MQDYISSTKGQIMESLGKKPPAGENPVIPVDQLPGEESDYGAFRAFFTPVLIEGQLLFTPKARDLEPIPEQPPVYEVGFVFYGHPTGNTEVTGSTAKWDKGLTRKRLIIGNQPMQGIAHVAYFPDMNFEHVVISPSSRPKAFTALLEILETTLDELKSITVAEPRPFRLENYL